jgi:hypothetical protein
MRKRTKAERLAARTGRSTQPWDRDTWLHRYIRANDPTDAQVAELRAVLTAPAPTAGRKNQASTRPQNPKGDNKGGSKTGRGGRGNKGGKG